LYNKLLYVKTHRLIWVNQGATMDKEELLNLYLEKLRLVSLEKLHARDISVIEALKEAVLYIEGEMQGY